jgi:hypothetical protein
MLASHSFFGFLSMISGYHVGLLANVCYGAPAMPRLYLLHHEKRSTGQSKTVRLFQTACAALQIDCEVLQMDGYPLSRLPDLRQGDALYRISTTHKARVAEQMMLHAGVRTFYEHWTNGFRSRVASYFLHQKLGLPVIPSFPFAPVNSDELATAVERLGDFPLIVKVRGGSKGVGVMRVDSLPSFRSVVDYVHADETPMLIRKYIPHAYYARVVVVGDQVVASHITHARDDEFRTNAGPEERKREVGLFAPEVQRMAMQAVHSLGFTTGGVDLLFDEHDRPYIAEVNFPNDFTTTQEVTGIDIAQAMVRHLFSL